MRKIRYFLFRFKRLIKYRLFGVKHFDRRVPRKGQKLLSCCSDEADKIKTVVYCSVWNDTIEYAGGSVNSVAHCGWQHI